MTPWEHLIDYERRRLHSIINDLRRGFTNADDLNKLHSFIEQALEAKLRAGAAEYWRGEPIHDYRSEL